VGEEVSVLSVAWRQAAGEKTIDLCDFNTPTVMNDAQPKDENT